MDLVHPAHFLCWHKRHWWIWYKWQWAKTDSNTVVSAFEQVFFSKSMVLSSFSMILSQKFYYFHKIAIFLLPNSSKFYSYFISQCFEQTDAYVPLWISSIDLFHCCQQRKCAAVNKINVPNRPDVIFHQLTDWYDALMMSQSYFKTKQKHNTHTRAPRVFG